MRETNIGRIYTLRDTLMSPERRRRRGRPVLGRTCRPNLLLTTLAAAYKTCNQCSQITLVKLIECICLFSVFCSQSRNRRIEGCGMPNLVFILLWKPSARFVFLGPLWSKCDHKLSLKSPSVAPSPHAAAARLVCFPANCNTPGNNRIPQSVTLPLRSPC